jgi:hypothetical protein
VRNALAEIKQNLAFPSQDRVPGSPPSTLEPDKIAAGG